MQKACVRELKPFSLAELAEITQETVDQTRSLVDELLSRGIVRYRTNDAARRDYSEDQDRAKPDEVYEFRFVGLLLVRDVVIVSYPKYFCEREPSDEELRLVFQAIERSCGFAVEPHLEDGGEKADDRLSVMLALLDLYDEYGEYSNYIEGRELNGNGSIDWNRTINNHLPILSKGRPIYTELETRKTFRDDSDFIMRLHRAVLTECSRVFQETGVGELLSLSKVWLSDEEVSDFGDVDSLEWCLSRERSSQFVDWKLRTLDLLERYLLSKESEVRRNEVQALGTTSFYNVWERACGVALGNVLHRSLDELGLNLAGKWITLGREELLDIIPRPKWKRATDEGYIDCGSVSTLIPDAVAFATNSHGLRAFCIYDAKYYLPTRHGNIRYQPGVESVTKQFLYQSAYKEFAVDHGFNLVVNAFLVPDAENEIAKLGRVTFKEVMGEVEIASPLSNYVYMWALPANRILEAYVSNTNISSELGTIWDRGER